MENLFLIGMMGSWKSTVGCKLASTLDMEFIDTDDAIEEITEMKIVDIFREFWSPICCSSTPVPSSLWLSFPKASSNPFCVSGLT